MDSINSLTSLFEEYPQKITGNDEYQIFKEFYSNDMSSIEIWIKTKFLLKKCEKHPKKSRMHRKEGNKLYAKNKFKDSIKRFTEALNFAEYDSEEYSLALGNRSAALFHLKDYQSCIKDIDNCLNGNCPNRLKPKVYVRKAECLQNLGCLGNEFMDVTENVLNTTEIESEERKKLQEKLKKLNIKLEKVANLIPSNINYNVTKNPNFAYASDAIKLCYNETKGRHVKASRNVKQGEILFVEDPLFFAPVFLEDNLTVLNKCHNCLSDIIASIPCEGCTLIVYCDEKCRDNSWNEFHKWECAGIRACIWFDLGIAFPAFRALVKGVKSGFPKNGKGFQKIVEKFGDEGDNYLYFNSLLTNMEFLDDLTQILVLSAIVVKYLERETDFFIFAKQHLKTLTEPEIKIKCGGMLARHILQLSGNSSVIEHWSAVTRGIPEECLPIACAIFPSISMMNHSCKANITIYYDKSTAIVRALNDIKENDEIFNCYGVDYRSTDFDTRKNLLNSIYHFTCDCEICSNADLEFRMFNCYLCQECEGPINNVSGVCYKCKKHHLLEFFKNLELRADKYVDRIPLRIIDVDQCHKIRTSIYVKGHMKINECLNLYYSLYKNQGNLIESLKYINKYVDSRKISLGSNTRSIALETVNMITDVIKDMEKQRKSIEMNNLNELKQLYEEARQVLLLYYFEDDLRLCEIEKILYETS